MYFLASHSFLVFFTITFSSGNQEELETLFTWTKLTYLIGTHPNAGKHYIAENNAIGNVRSFRGQFYACVPRWRTGVPSTLNKIEKGGILAPFPNAASNRVGECEKALQNVAALEIDNDGFLWALDSGTSAIFDSAKACRKCPAKLVQIPLILMRQEEMMMMHTVHTFPEMVISKNSLIMHMVIDGSQFYLADAILGRLVKFNSGLNTSVVIEAEMRPAVAFKGQLSPFNMHFGLTGLALSWRKSSQSDKEKLLYFGTLSKDLLSMPTQMSSVIKKLGERLGMCEAMTADNQGNIYMGLLNNPAATIVKWNTSNPLQNSSQEILVTNSNLSWINSIWISEGYLYFVHNNFQAFLHAKLDFNGSDSNFGLHRIQLKTNDDEGHPLDSYLALSSSASAKAKLLYFNSFRFMDKLVLLSCFLLPS